MIRIEKWMMGIALVVALPMYCLEEIIDETQEMVDQLATSQEGVYRVHEEPTHELNPVLPMPEIHEHALTQESVEKEVRHKRSYAASFDSGLDEDANVSHNTHECLPEDKRVRENKNSDYDPYDDESSDNNELLDDDLSDLYDNSQKQLPAKKKQRASYACLVEGCTHEPFKSSKGLREHTRFVHEGRKFTCEIEGCTHAPFTSFWNLKQHIEGIHEGKRYPCDVEGCTYEPFKTDQRLRAHKKIIHEEKKYSCKIEGCTFQPFSSLVNLNKHVESVHEGKKHLCDVEGCTHKPFKTPQGLKEHKESIHEGKGFVCTIEGCTSHSFSSAGNLRQHIKNIHEKKKQQKVNDLAFFMRAAKSNKWRAIKTLLNAGIHSDTPDEQGDTALLKAARHNAVESVQLLLTYGAHKMCVNAQRETPAHEEGVYRVHEEPTHELNPVLPMPEVYEHALTQESVEKEVGRKRSYGASLDSGLDEDANVSQKTHESLPEDKHVRENKDTNYDPYDDESSDNNELLDDDLLDLYDISQKQLPAKKKQRANHTCDVEGCTSEPFINFCDLKRHIEVFHEGNAQQGVSFFAYLMYAAEVNNWQAITIFLNTGLHIDTIDEQGDTALLKAVRHNAIESVQVLLSYGANRMSMNARGETPLVLAGALGHTEIVQLLLQDAQES